jgi:WD40 repeat protein
LSVLVPQIKAAADESGPAAGAPTKRPKSVKITPPNADSTDKPTNEAKARTKAPSGGEPAATEKPTTEQPAVGTPVATTQRGGCTVIPAHEVAVSDLVFSADGGRLASISQKGEVAVFDVAHWTKVVGTVPGDAAFPEGRDERLYLAFTPKGKTLICGSAAQALLWNPTNGKLRATIGREPQYSHDTGLVVAAKGKMVATLEESNGGGARFIVADVGNGKTWHMFDDPERRGATRRMALSPDSAVLAVSCDTEVHLFDVPNKQELPPIKGLQGNVEQLAFSPDGARLLCHEGGRISAFVVKREAGALPQFQFRVDVPAKDVDSLEFLPDGRTLAFIGSDEIVLWDPDSQQVRC